jgi:hypothetical protein
MMNTKSIKVVLNRHTRELMSLQGVVGIAQGLCNDQTCIKVFVTEKTEEIMKNIPHEIESYPVEVEETGEIKAMPPKK